MTKLAILLTAAAITSLAALYLVLRLLSHEEDDYGPLELPEEETWLGI